MKKLKELFRSIKYSEEITNSKGQKPTNKQMEEASRRRQRWTYRNE